MRGYVMKDGPNGVSYLAKKRMSAGDKVCWTILAIVVVVLIAEMV